MKMLKKLLLPLVTLLLTACASRTTQNESQMTSFTAGENKADTANLFTLPADQIAHLQIAPAVRGSLPRVLRFTGSVAYNALATTPVFSAAGGPVQRNPGHARRHGTQGAAASHVNSPDYSQARSTYLKARDALELADKNYKRATRSVRAQSHRRTRSAAGGIRPRRKPRPTWNPAPMPCARWASPIPKPR